MFLAAALCGRSPVELGWKARQATTSSARCTDLRGLKNFAFGPYTMDVLEKRERVDLINSGHLLFKPRILTLMGVEGGSLKNVDHLYIVHNLRNIHWVVLEADCLKWKVWAHDSFRHDHTEVLGRLARALSKAYTVHTKADVKFEVGG